MPTNLLMSEAAVNAEAERLGDLCANGYIRIYDGVQPPTPDTAVSGQVLLAELRMTTPAFSAAIGGVITTTVIENEDDAPASGIATWCRFLAEDLTPLFDGSVGLAGSLLNINSVSIQQHAVVSISAYTHTVPKP